MSVLRLGSSVLGAISSVWDDSFRSCVESTHLIFIKGQNCMAVLRLVEVSECGTVISCIVS